MRILLVSIAALIIAIAGVSAYRITTAPSNTGQTATACAMDAQLCPDGSSVGRTGPNCDFAQCPGAPRGAAAVAGTVEGGVDAK